KKIKYILTISLISFGIFSCENADFGDINEYVNGPKEIYTPGLLSQAIMSYATSTNRDGLMKPTLYVQYQSQVTYTDEMLYASSASSWFTYYVSVLNNLQLIIDFCSLEENQTPAQDVFGSPENQI